jgi:hypothetical protein
VLQEELMKVFRLIRQFAREVQSLSLRLSKLERKLDQMKELAAKNIINRVREHGLYEDIHRAEFKVYSQFGDDGIIQYLINNVEIEERTFVEFGVENYTESNTRFLLVNDNWRGLVIDGSEANIESIKTDEIYWKHDLTAVERFIDKNNINEIIAANNFSRPLGILSIDIDGNDYWIWESINVVDPAIVIVEYNSVFGKERAVTIAYDPAFTRSEAHPSNLYWGCSLKALCLLAEKKGYVFVGCNSNGNNAYFVRKDKVNGIRQHTVESGYVLSRFRESRNADGTLSYLSGDERKKAIGKMTVYDLEKGTLVKIEDL